MKLFQGIAVRLGHLVSNSPSVIYNISRDLIVRFDLLNIVLNVYRNRPFTLVYQQGRVGSTSVYETLKFKKLPGPIYHVHWLNDKNIEAVKKKNANNVVHRYLLVGEILSRYLPHKENREFNSERWKVITVIREPVSLIISTLFMNAEKYFANLIVDDYVDEKKVLKKIEEMFGNDDIRGWEILRWFDEEFFVSLGINVFDIGLIKRNAFHRIGSRCYDVLILKFECIDKGFKEGVADLYGLERECLVLKNSNPHKDRRFTHIQKYVLDNLKLPYKVREDLYSAKYVTHFYTKEEILTMQNRWV